MGDLEITRLCAEAMGWPKNAVCAPEALILDGDTKPYDPLHDDAQAMALVKAWKLHISPPDSQDNRWEAYTLRDELDPDSGVIGHALAETLNRAICECVAKLKQGEP